MAPTRPAAGRPSGRLRGAGARQARRGGRAARAAPRARARLRARRLDRARPIRVRGARARTDCDQLRGAGGGRDQVDLVRDAGEAVGVRAQQRVDRQLRARQAPRAQVACQLRERPARAPPPSPRRRRRWPCRSERPSIRGPPREARTAPGCRRRRCTPGITRHARPAHGAPWRRAAHSRAAATAGGRPRGPALESSLLRSRCSAAVASPGTCAPPGPTGAARRAAAAPSASCHGGGATARAASGPRGVRDRAASAGWRACATKCLQAVTARSGSPRPASAARTPAQWRMRAPAWRGDTPADIAPSTSSAAPRSSCARAKRCAAQRPVRSAAGGGPPA